MENAKHPVDSFFKEALQGHQVVPSEESKQRFLSEALSLESGRKTGARRWWLYWTALGLISITAILLFFLRPEPPPQSVNTVSTELQVTKPVTPMNDQAPVRQILPGLATASTSLMAEQSIPTYPIPVEKSTDSILNSHNVADYSVLSDQLPDAASVNEDSSTKPAAISSETEPVVSVDQSQVSKKVQNKPFKPWHFTSSVSYTPEWMFNTLEGNKYVTNLALEGTFYYGRYSVRTGAGLSLTDGTNELAVEYNDFLGSYKQLDSITFQWDSRHYYLIPTYYLSDRNVWDSLLKLDYPKVIKRYTYLQVPLILGYDFLQKKGFTMGFRAGPILSILLESRQLSGGVQSGPNRIIRINQITPDRIQTNWQVSGSVNLSVLLSRRFIIEFEPVVKYYFNSVYEKSEITKKPWSVGLRTAVTFGF